MSEKILIICEALNVTPYELLGCTDGRGLRNKPSNLIVIDKNSERGEIISEFLSMDANMLERIIGYMKALQEMMVKQEADNAGETA